MNKRGVKIGCIWEQDHLSAELSMPCGENGAGKKRSQWGYSKRNFVQLKEQERFIAAIDQLKLCWEGGGWHAELLPPLSLPTSLEMHAPSSARVTQLRSYISRGLGELAGEADSPGSAAVRGTTSVPGNGGHSRPPACRSTPMELWGPTARRVMLHDTAAKYFLPGAALLQSWGLKHLWIGFI